MTQRILILSHDNKIGDAIVATGLFAPLRERFPDCEIGILCGASNAALYRFHPAVKWLHISSSRNVFARIWAALKARLIGYDVVVHFGLDLANPSVQIMLNTVNAKQRFLFLTHPTQPHATDVVMAGDWHNLHYSARHQRFLQALGAISEPYRYNIHVDSEAVSSAPQHEGILMVINSQSSTDNRSLSMAWLREFVTVTLQQHSGMHIQLLSANSAHEAEQRHAFADLGQRVSVSTCHPSVSQSLAIIQAADVVLSPDTYAVHAAGAWNIPVIALYEPSSTTMDLWGPASDSYVQICAPAGKTVSDIGVEDASQALAHLLTAPHLRERVLLK
jgi:ADP-heptose:LPS heptosyltransferase